MGEEAAGLEGLQEDGGADGAFGLSVHCVGVWLQVRWKKGRGDSIIYIRVMLYSSCYSSCCSIRYTSDIIP